MSVRFPFFKGATRVATVWGVPLIPLVVLAMGMATFAMFFGIWWLALIVPVWLLMAQITKSDDRAFRIVWLWLQTKVWNRLRHGDFWGASTYAPTDERRRSWEK